MKKPITISNVLENNDLIELKSSISKLLINNNCINEESIGRRSIEMKDCQFLLKHLKSLTQIAKTIFESKTLIPTYAFFSEYSSPNSVLPKHKDNNGNTYTIDLCLYTNKPWGLFIEGKEYALYENQAICFYGEEQEHWRENLNDNNCVGMIFFHYAEPHHDFFDFKKSIKMYENEGFVLLKNAVENEIPDYNNFIDEKSEIVFEKDMKTIRSIYAFHNNSDFNYWLSNQKMIFKFVTTILGSEVYLYQSKINFKNNNNDSVWPYHRDFPFWNVFDNIQKNRMINVVIYLEDVVEGSGDIKFIPQSHNYFLEREVEDSKTVYSLEGSSSNDSLFTFSKEEISQLTSKFGLQNSCSPKGSILLFNPNIIYGSEMAHNNSNRKLMILTFNSCENIPVNKSLRPSYLSNNDYDPIKWILK